MKIELKKKPERLLNEAYKLFLQPNIMKVIKGYDFGGGGFEAQSQL